MYIYIYGWVEAPWGAQLVRCARLREQLVFWVNRIKHTIIHIGVHLMRVYGRRVRRKTRITLYIGAAHSRIDLDSLLTQLHHRIHALFIGKVHFNYSK